MNKPILRRKARPPDPADREQPEPIRDPPDPTNPVDPLRVDPADPTKPIGPKEEADVSSAGS